MRLVKLSAVVMVAAVLGGCQYNDTERAVGGAAAGAVAASALGGNAVVGAAGGAAAGALCDDAGLC